MESKKEQLEQTIISCQKSVDSGEFDDQVRSFLLAYIEDIKRQLATFEPGYIPPPKPIYPKNTLTDDEKDEIDVLADAAEDMHGIPEIAAMGVKQARAAIRRLVQKEWISLFWYEYWCAPGEPEELTGEKLESALIDLEKNKWWKWGTNVKKGYYAFFITEKGLTYYQSDLQVKDFMCREWKARAMKRGVRFYDGAGNLDTSDS